jgi:hypothetical protein
MDTHEVNISIAHTSMQAFINTWGGQKGSKMMWKYYEKQTKYNDDGVY